MFAKAFWKASAERSLKSGAQFVVLTIAAGAIAGTGDAQAQVVNAFLLDWPTLGGVFLGGILISVLTSIITAKVTDGNPSAVSAEVLSPPAPPVSPENPVVEAPGFKAWDDGRVQADRIDGPDHRAE